MNLHEKLTLKEVTKSLTAKRKGIDNTPNADQLVNLTIWASMIFAPIRDHFKVPIHISSGFRSPELNVDVGGSETSFHCQGKAGDLDQDNQPHGVTNADVFWFIFNNLNYTELIWEFGDDKNPDWVHCAYDKFRSNEKETLIVYRDEDGERQTAMFSQENLNQIYQS